MAPPSPWGPLPPHGATDGLALLEAAARIQSAAASSAGPAGALAAACPIATPTGFMPPALGQPPYAFPGAAPTLPGSLSPADLYGGGPVPMGALPAGLPWPVGLLPPQPGDWPAPGLHAAQQAARPLSADDLAASTAGLLPGGADLMLQLTDATSMALAASDPAAWLAAAMRPVPLPAAAVRGPHMGPPGGGLAVTDPRQAWLQSGGLRMALSGFSVGSVKPEPIEADWVGVAGPLGLALPVGQDAHRGSRLDGKPPARPRGRPRKPVGMMPANGAAGSAWTPRWEGEVRMSALDRQRQIKREHMQRKLQAERLIPERISLLDEQLKQEQLQLSEMQSKLQEMLVLSDTNLICAVATLAERADIQKGLRQKLEEATGGASAGPGASATRPGPAAGPARLPSAGPDASSAGPSVDRQVSQHDAVATEPIFPDRPAASSLAVEDASLPLYESIYGDRATPEPCECVRGALPDWMDGTFLRLAHLRWDIDGPLDGSGVNGTGQQRLHFRHWYDGFQGVIELDCRPRGAGRSDRITQRHAFFDFPEYRAAQCGKMTQQRFFTRLPRQTWASMIAGYVQQCKLRNPLGDDNCLRNGIAAIYLLAGRVCMSGLISFKAWYTLDESTLATNRRYWSANDELKAMNHGSACWLLDPADPASVLSIGMSASMGKYKFFRIENITDVQPSGIVPAEPLELSRAEIGSVRMSHKLCQSMVFSFGATPGYLFLPEFPCVVDYLHLFLTGREMAFNMFDWKPALGTCFHLVRRSDRQVTSFKLPQALWAWTMVNTWELPDGTGVAADMIADDEPNCSVIRAMEMTRLRAGGCAPPGLPGNHVLRVIIRFNGPDAAPGEGSGAARTYASTSAPSGLFMGGGLFSRSVGAAVADSSTLELHELAIDRASYGGHLRTTLSATPTAAAVNPHFFGRPYRYFYSTCCSGQPRTTCDQLCRVDVETCQVLRWGEPSCFVGSTAVFVPRPGGTDETDGAVVADVSGPSGAFWVVLDAATMTELSRHALPYRLPAAHATLFVPRVDRLSGGNNGIEEKADSHEDSSGSRSSVMRP